MQNIINKNMSYKLNLNTYLPALQIIGSTVSIMAGVKLVNLAWLYFLRPFPALRNLYGSNSWALITGGSAGIGLEMAKILVKQGINVILMARDKNRLDNTAKELSILAPNVEIRILPMDAETPDYDIIIKCVDGLNISLLINNVGVHNSIPTNTEDMTADEVNKIISVNCNFQVNLTAMLIPILKKNSFPKRHSTILNISSLTSQMSMPMLGVYAATKTFEEHWSTNLAAEVEPFHVDVQCLRPGITVSQMSGITEPSFFCPSAGDMAYCCLRMIGYKKVSIAPYWPHAFLDFVNGLMPERFSWSIVRKMHQDKRDLLMKNK